jgi:DNA-binding FadR family transcriptional regulator
MSNVSFAALTSVPAYRVVERRIRTAVLDGAIKPGALLPTEETLADQFGVTRSTVREAIRSLENSGLVDRGPRRRLRIALPTHNMLDDAFHRAIVLHSIKFREIWEAHMAIEPMTAELAAQRASPKLLKALDDNLARTKTVLNRTEELVAADIEFHALVAEASGNRALMLARDPLSRFLFPSYEVVIRKLDPGRRLLVAHTNIVAAIKMHDGAAARSWMDKHIRDFRRGYELAGQNPERTIKAGIPQGG